MCGDLAISTDDVAEAWKVVVKLFKVVKRFSSLRLNAPKTQVLFACEDFYRSLMRMLLASDSDLRPTSFRNYIKYLGVHLGPGACDHQWNEIQKGYKDVVDFIRNLHSGITSSIVLYNVLAHSKFSYVASFVRPSREMLKLEDWGCK